MSGPNTPSMNSPYGAGAPTYESAEMQKATLDGRLKVAVGIRDRAKSGSRTHARWSQIVDQLLDRRAEVMGR